MTTPSSRRIMIKDLIVLSVVASLLIILPLIRSYGFNNSYGSVSSLEQDQVASEARRTHAKPQEIIEDMAFIEEVFPKVSAWEMTKFEPYLAAETRSEARTREIGYVLDTLATRLGELEHFTQPQPMTIAELSTDSDGDELSAYEFVAYYETGVAGINLVLGEDDGESALYSFNINIQDKLRVL